MDQIKLQEAISTLQSFLEISPEKIKETVTDLDRANALFEVILSKFLPIYSELVLKTENLNIEINYHNKLQKASFNVRFKHNFDIENKNKIVSRNSKVTNTKGELI